MLQACHGCHLHSNALQVFFACDAVHHFNGNVFAVQAPLMDGPEAARPQYPFQNNFVLEIDDRDGVTRETLSFIRIMRASAW